MRVGRIVYRNIGAFSGVDVDLSALSGKLTAITGDNGAGKSTFCELIAGAMYRTCPTRGSLGDLATARDAMVSVELLDVGVTIRQQIDGVSKRAEASVDGADGTVRLESAKVRDFDAWAERHLPSPLSLYASSFTAQGSGGFVDLPAADRKRAILKLTGTDRLERLAEAARQNSRKAAASLAALSTQRATVVSMTPDETRAAATLEACQTDLARLVVELDHAADTLDNVRAASVDNVERRRQWAARRDLSDTLDALTLDAQTIAARIETAARTIANGDAIRHAADESRRLGDELARLATETAVAETVRKQQAIDVQATRDAATAVKTRIAAVEKTRDDAALILSERADVTAAADRVASLDAEIAATVTTAAAIDEAVAAMQARLLAAKDTRIGFLREGLEAVQDHGVDMTETGEHARIATTALGADLALAESFVAMPANIDKQRRTKLDAERTLGKLRAARQACATLASRASRFAQAETAVAGCEIQIVELVELEKLCAASQAQAADGRALNASALVALGKATADCRARLAVVEPLAAQLAQLESATERHADLMLRVGPILAEIERTTARLATLSSTQPEPDDVDAAAAAHARALAACNVARATKTRAEVDVEVAAAGRAEVAKIDEAVRVVSAEHSDWTRLGADLGKDGLQALVVDCALPELNTLSNDLLLSCHGPRFTVEITSQRASADGKRQIEDLEIVVTDTDRGRVDTIETYSGGERVILGEAIALALTTVACQNAGLERPTLIRDESGAALTEANGRAYVAMLRRAVDMIGADRCLFVSHNPELQALADSWIRVGDGTATVHE